MKGDITKKILISISVVSLCLSALIAIAERAKTDNVFTFGPKKIKLLIVPGHEPDAGGALYGNIKERDLDLALSLMLKDKLASHDDVEVTLARNENGWNKDLEEYVLNNETEIMDWVALMKEKMFAKVDAGEMKIIDPDMKHNEATSNAVLFLYGTNKWIEEKDIDMVLHVHFNNNPKYKGKPNYRGYCMYIPEHQYGNFASSRIFASYLNEEMFKIEKKSDMPQERDIIIEDQELIATGNYDTLKIPSVALEYAYIYEPVMTSSSTRNAFMEKAASSTAEAIRRYINNLDLQ
ncbi:MAG: N-acetylmuramoyl-L-alanine amidase [Candidatus Paceibacterota bacterium]|jgi:hypothetical protein